MNEVGAIWPTILVVAGAGRGGGGDDCGPFGRGGIVLILAFAVISRELLGGV